MNHKKILIITYYWPPSGGPGVQRWLKFVKYLPEFGWKPTIFIPENPSYPIVDETLEKEVSKDFILSEEGYDRKFYAGFLGEINQNQQGDVDLFVNLRCMEIEKNKIHLYIGCGITKDSNPEKEYYETANKAMTMKEILK